MHTNVTQLTKGNFEENLCPTKCIITIVKLDDHQNHLESFFNIKLSVGLKPRHLYFEEFPQVILMITQVWPKIEHRQAALSLSVSVSLTSF